MCFLVRVTVDETQVSLIRRTLAAHGNHISVKSRN